jgi:hypothetical protein
MAGTVTATTIQNDTSSPPTFRNNSVEIGTLCRAWLNIYGNSTVPTIRASFNVSSVTWVTNSRYTISFITAMPDANYAVAIGFTGPGMDTRYSIQATSYEGPPTLMTSSQIQIAGWTGRTGSDTVTLAIFR